MKILTQFLLSCAVLAVTFVGASAQVETGKPAPDFTLPGADGQNHALAAYKGKYVVLEWTNHDCPFVKKHYSGGAMQATQKKYTGKGVVWLQVISSAPGSRVISAPHRPMRSTRHKARRLQRRCSIPMAKWAGSMVRKPRRICT